MALRELGYETVMINCNPETVSTDYSTSDRLYFEPLTPEDVAEVIAAEQAACTDGARVVGVIVSLGGQTPLKLSHSLDPALVLGTPGGLDRRGRGPRAVVGHLPATWACASLRATSRSPSTTRAPSSTTIGYPVLVRPSYVLGGRAMEIVYDDDSLARVMANLTERPRRARARGRRVGDARPS